ncbi:MAG: tyrosine-type recombinase/integrase [bacterium]
MRRWDGLVEGYVRECEIRGLAATTMVMRRSALARAGTWLKLRRPKVNLEQMESEMLIEYLRTRSAFRSKTVVASTVSILRGMGEYLVSQGVWTKNPMRWIRGPKMDPRSTLPRRIGKADMKRIWDEAEKIKSPSVRAVTLCVLAILYGSGLRRGELERMNMSDWDRENGLLRVDGRKTGQERKVPVGAGVWRCVEAYLPVRQNRLESACRLEETALLIDRFGNRMRADAISRVVRACAVAAGIPFVSLHQFRHSCASDLLESGVKMPEVQAMLGHGVLATTMRYLHVSGDVMSEAIKKHPINEFLDPEPEATERRAVI